MVAVPKHEAHEAPMEAMHGTGRGVGAGLT